MPSAHELAQIIVARQRELDHVMRADLRRFQDRYGDLLLTAAIKLADKQLRASEPRKPRPKAEVQQAPDPEAILLDTVEQVTGVRS
jgi:hypothetical protein